MFSRHLTSPAVTPQKKSKKTKANKDGNMAIHQRQLGSNTVNIIKIGAPIIRKNRLIKPIPMPIPLSPIILNLANIITRLIALIEMSAAPNTAKRKNGNEILISNLRCKVRLPMQLCVTCRLHHLLRSKNDLYLA